VRDTEQGGFADALQLLREQRMHVAFGAPAITDEQSTSNTTLAVIATNARLTKTQATKLAQMAQNGLPRAIRPVHTPFDGDAVFALSVGDHPPPHMTILGTVAADVLERAIHRAATEAHAMGGLPAARDLV
jgi:L-aminopeptidase/D-esterase-like protein